MRPSTPLPIDPSWQSTEEYVQSLLTFVSTSTIFRNLCGGVHILDFLTRKPDLYSWVLPQDWRLWFDDIEVKDVLDLLLREDLTQFSESIDVPNHLPNSINGQSSGRKWRGYSLPPKSLVDYVSLIRRHSLCRDYLPPSVHEPLPRHVAVGMKPKKIHEVTEFAAFVDQLSSTLNSSNDDATNTEKDANPMVIDFGSGQNYLGRTLACPPYNKQVVAIEQRGHNVKGAKSMDVYAKLAQKEKRMINKKEYKRLLLMNQTDRDDARSPKDNEISIIQAGLEVIEDASITLSNATEGVYTNGNSSTTIATTESLTTLDAEEPSPMYTSQTDMDPEKGRIKYVEKELSSGDLSEIVQSDYPDLELRDGYAASSVVVSIHSCGNLTHHALRSLTLNPHVRAVAIIGCCYNLLTERLGPATFKLPSLRSYHPRLEATSSSYDPHGFPMSKTLEEFELDIPPDGTDNKISVGNGKGVRLNITARMMAVQAPHNWGSKDSEEFFTRHFYRALLQRIFLELGIVQMATEGSLPYIETAGGTLSGKDPSGTPLIIGTLRKSCFTSFPVYVRGAIEKLRANPVDGDMIRSKSQCLLDDPTIIERYEREYAFAKKHLSIIWSLMAFSANVVESTILVDRWLWLKEQENVKDAWIQSVFDYRQSPRNMVVVGLKD